MTAGFVSKHVRDNIVLVLISFVAFLHEPVIVFAESSPYTPMPLANSLNLTRGDLSPGSGKGMYLSHEESCAFVQKEFGWSNNSCSSIENLVFQSHPGTDTIIIDKPDTSGFVKFDDWDKKETAETIDEIWGQLVSDSKAQGEAIGSTITPIRWVVYPHLNKEKKYLYYATLIEWDNNRVINIKASAFDRYGYVVFRIVPDREDYSEPQLTQIVEDVLGGYRSSPQNSYLSFQEGDKVAAAGAVGVLATLVGVKYGKAIAGGMFAAALFFLKKFWFVFCLPVLWLFKKFKNKET